MQDANRRDEQKDLRILELEQGSSEWLLWRSSGIGSSDAPVIMNGTHFGKTREKLWNEKLGKVLPKAFSSFQNARMHRGQVLEPDARAWYSSFVNKEVKPICAVHGYLDWLKGSLDGWIAESRTILEIKAPNDKDHNTALEHRIPEKYIPQCNHLLLVTGGSVVHYLSYSPTRPRLERYALVSHKPCAETLRSMIKKEEVFWECLKNEIVPQDHMFL